MRVKLSEKEVAALVAKGATVTSKAVHFPMPAQVEQATMMAWSEKEFSDAFAVEFERLGYTGYHTWLSIKSKKGFPDWVLARPGRCLFVELKEQKGKLKPEQEMWRDILIAAGQEWHCFRPSDWEEIMEVLK